MKSIKPTVCLATLAVALAVTGTTSANAETLGDVLRENGWDRVIGTWVDVETGGHTLKITYAWRFEDTLIEVTSWQEGKESLSFMGRNAKTGEVYHFGADSKGGGSLGAWSEEDGHAILGLLYVTADGEEGGMRVRFRLEDDDTLMMAIEGPEAKAIKLVRAGKRTDRRPERKGDERKVDKAAVQRKRDGVFTEAGTMVYVDTPIRSFDTNENLTVEDEELQKGYLELLKRYEDAHGKLLTLFDADGDGVLSETEGQAARRLAFGIASLLPHDRDGDWHVDETEADQAWERLTEQCERHNEGNLKRFDKNQDGELSEEETATAQRMIRHWRAEGGR